MSAIGTVFYISDCAVDEKGSIDPFMRQELPWLLTHFKRVLMVSHAGVAELTGVEVSSLDKVQVEKPKGGLKAWFSGLTSPDVWQELWRMLRQGLGSLANVGKLFLFAVRGYKLHFWLETLLKDCDIREVTLYAYWMNYDAYAGALSKRKHREVRFVTRGHAFEIDPCRNPLNPYLMKRQIAKEADGLFLISEYAKTRYLSYMQAEVPLEKVHVVGVGSQGKAVPLFLPPSFSAAGKLRLVSCAGIVLIKQIPLLVDALAAWEGMPLEWLHMGGGSDEEAVRAYAKERLAKKESISYRITGRMENAEVQKIYQEKSFDLFVNTSRMEGVPVSIMEAMRFGIPIVAPRVGGIPELVDDTVGILYAPEEGAEGVRRALETFAELPEEKTREMRKAAKTRWDTQCQCEELLPRIFALKKEGEKL